MELDKLTSFPGIEPGTVFLITGGSGAIGLRCAQAVLNIGGRVAVVGRSRERIEEVADALGGAGDVLGIAGDIAKTADNDHAVAQVLDKWGAIDVLVNSAAVGDTSRELSQVSEREIATVLSINVGGAILAARAVADAMQRRRQGRIVNVSSIAAHRVQPGRHIYSASKAAIIHLTRQLAVELGPFGITVNSVSPGQTPTHLRRFDEDPGKPPVEAEGVTGSPPAAIPLRRRGELDDFVGPILFLASGLASYMTGVDLPVEGGAMLARPLY